MKNFHRAFLVVFTVLSLTLTSCSSDTALTPSDTNERANTYVGLSISLPKDLHAATRAGDSTLPQNHNSNGTWDGRDVIQSITTYMVGEKSVVKTAYSDNLSIDSEGRIWPVVTAKSEVGNVKAFVVINSNAKLTQALDNSLESPEKFVGLLSTEVQALASDLANSTASKDVIVMTNTVIPVSTPIEANVNEAAARSGKNKISVNVERITSRGIVTVGTETQNQEVKVKDARGTDISKIKITKVEYGVGQSNIAVYPIKVLDFTTPNSNTSTSVDWEGLNGKLDNSGLNELFVPQIITDKTEVLKALAAEESAKYILPLVHGKYFKGNTTFFEVRAKFEVIGDLADTKAPQTEEQKNIYLGMQDGKFYADRNTALGMGEALTKEQVDNGEYKQKVYTYVNNEMVYVMWLNPNNIPGSGIKATKSPVVRNQVYHAHIKRFKEIGVPYNPLNPTDPSKPEVDPKDPTKPVDPTEPVNPIDPIDPLQNEDTYLSVEISVLDWGVHSYESELGNDY